MSDQPEVIRQQIRETQNHLAENLGALEDHVAQTVHQASAAVHRAKDTVQETIHSIKSTFDVGRQLRRHPFLVLGGAAAVGYLAPRLLRGSGTGPSIHTELRDWVSNLASTYANELKPHALGATLGLVRGAVVQAAPEAIRDTVTSKLDQLASWLGVTVVSAEETAGHGLSSCPT
jgi:hypothetical protein